MIKNGHKQTSEQERPYVYLKAVRKCQALYIRIVSDEVLATYKT